MRLRLGFELSTSQQTCLGVLTKNTLMLYKLEFIYCLFSLFKTNPSVYNNFVKPLSIAKILSNTNFQKVSL